MTTVETLDTTGGCIARARLATTRLWRSLAGEARRGGQDERDEEGRKVHDDHRGDPGHHRSRFSLPLMLHAPCRQGPVRLGGPGASGDGGGMGASGDGGGLEQVPKPAASLFGATLGAAGPGAYRGGG
jgi:hypothetical protein